MGATHKQAFRNTPIVSKSKSQLVSLQCSTRLRFRKQLQYNGMETHLEYLMKLGPLQELSFKITNEPLKTNGLRGMKPYKVDSQ